MSYLESFNGSEVQFFFGVENILITVSFFVKWSICIPNTFVGTWVTNTSHGMNKTQKKNHSESQSEILQKYKTNVIDRRFFLNKKALKCI